MYRMVYNDRIVENQKRQTLQLIAFDISHDIVVFTFLLFATFVVVVVIFRGWWIVVDVCVCILPLFVFIFDLCKCHNDKMVSNWHTYVIQNHIFWLYFSCERRRLLFVQQNEMFSTFYVRNYKITANGLRFRLFGAQIFWCEVIWGV